MVHSELIGIIGQIPEWKGAFISSEKIGGLTNANYRVEVNGERFVIRVSRGNSHDLGIDRRMEFEVLTVASKAGIAPEVVRFILPEGHAVTRCINGRHWTGEEYFQLDNLARLIAVIQKIHALPAVTATFSPFERVELFIENAMRLDAEFPTYFQELIDQKEKVRSMQKEDRSEWHTFCHNDLYYVNIMDDGNVRILDWEFAGMGDRYYDLAILVYAYESYGELTRELQEFILKQYFGEVTLFHWQRFDGMRFMLYFFNAMWALVQDGNVRAGKMPPAEGFNYREYADTVFNELRLMICC